MKNGIPRGGLGPLNIYYDLPFLVSRKYAYVGDLALMHTSNIWRSLEVIFSQDMTLLSAYLQTRRLKLSHSKTVTAAFHLNNKEAKHKFAINNNNKNSLLPFCTIPTYLGRKLNRSLTLYHLIKTLHKKINITCRIVGASCRLSVSTDAKHCESSSIPIKPGLHESQLPVERSITLVFSIVVEKRR